MCCLCRLPFWLEHMTLVGHIYLYIVVTLSITATLNQSLWELGLTSLSRLIDRYHGAAILFFLHANIYMIKPRLETAWPLCTKCESAL